jgi:CRP/FNR family transcriptional regulator, cyclic AMP receptor protein
MTLGASSEGTSTRTVSLLALDDELAEALPVADRPAASRLTTGRLIRLPVGPLSLGEREGLWGIYVVSGVLMRSVSLGRIHVPELAGPGDVVLPARYVETTTGARESLTVVEPVDALVLGQRFAKATGQWPQLLMLIARRAAAQRLRSATMTAIAHLSSADLRLLAVFWHLAETWGRVTVAGTVVPFPFTHETLGHMVGGRRPTISLALATLDKERLVSRLPDGTWLLPAGSDEVLRQRLAVDENPPEILLRARVVRQGARATSQNATALNAEARQAVKTAVSRGEDAPSRPRPDSRPP